MKEKLKIIAGFKPALDFVTRRDLRIFIKEVTSGHEIQSEIGHDWVMLDDIIGHRGVNHEITNKVRKCKLKK